MTIMPPIPNKLWIGEYEFDLVAVPPNHSALEKNDGMTYFHEGKRAIYICDSIELRRFFNVVWHEVTHAVNWDQGIEDGTKEEAISEAHGKIWTQVLLDNPKFHSWINKVIKQIRNERKNA